MKKLLTLVSLLVAFSGAVSAQEMIGEPATTSTVAPAYVGDFVLHEQKALYSVINFNDLSYRSPFTIGFKTEIQSRVSLDFNFGFRYAAERAEDSDTEVGKELSDLDFTIAAGVGYELMQGINSSLNGVGKLELGFNNINSGYQGENDAVEESYFIITKSIIAGVQPEYYFSSNFSIFTEAAIKLIFVGNSMYDKGNHKLEDRKDGRMYIETQALNLGLRYYFR